MTKEEKRDEAYEAYRVIRDEAEAAFLAIDYPAHEAYVEIYRTATDD